MGVVLWTILEEGGAGLASGKADTKKEVRKLKAR
jgi:hypothetical protein